MDGPAPASLIDISMSASTQGYAITTLVVDAMPERDQVVLRDDLLLLVTTAIRSGMWWCQSIGRVAGAAAAWMLSSNHARQTPHLFGLFLVLF